MQDGFWPTQGFITCTGVMRRWRVLSHARKAVTWLPLWGMILQMCSFASFETTLSCSHVEIGPLSPASLKTASNPVEVGPLSPHLTRDSSIVEVGPLSPHLTRDSSIVEVGPLSPHLTRDSSHVEVGPLSPPLTRDSSIVELGPLPHSIMLASHQFSASAVGLQKLI